MSAIITLGKVKLVYKGNWNNSESYSAGDIVNLVSDDSSSTYKQFIYKNSTAKTGSHPYIKVITGTVSSLAIRTNTVTITLSDNPGGNFDYYVIPNLSYFYSKYFPGDTLITAKTFVSSTQVTLTLSKYSTNTSTISSNIATIGSRRIANRYDRAYNTVDWDVYSESSRFRGIFSRTGNYDIGDIVTKNNQSYICVAPVGYGTGNVGPSSITPTVDPEFDYVGAWDNYLTGEKLKYEKAIAFPNTNPFNWKGHPFISSPTTGGTTSSGVSSTYQGNIPWTLQDNFKNHEHAWRWNTGVSARDEGYMSLTAIDGEGRQLSNGGLANNENFGATAGGSSYPFGYFTEGDCPSNNSYWTNDSPAYGNSVFNSSLSAPRNTPKIIQYIKTWATRLYLMSNGTVAIAGRNLNSPAFGYGEDVSSNCALEIPRSVFKDRSIVKISSSDNNGGNDGYGWAMALDEFGEVWMWGNNDVGQLGFGNETINPKETYEGLSTLGIGHEYDPTAGGLRKHYAPYCLESGVAFGGARIVDITCGLYSAYVYDENGYLWSWGYNNYGQLGYSTNTGFRFTDRSQAPRRITSPLGYTWTGSALAGTITVTGAITTNSAGLTYTKSSGAAWDAQVNSSVGYSGSVAVSAKTNSLTTYTMFGLNSDPNTDPSYSSIDFAWYFNSGTATVYENGVGAGVDKTYTYTTNTVLSIVFDANEGFVNYYFDLDGDGKYVQLVRRVLKTSVGGNTQSTPLYFDSSFYQTNANLTNIQITGTITQNTWNTYGGLQKFGAANNGSTGVDYFTCLDGQGNIWNTGYNNEGELGDGTGTNNNNTSALRRRKFGSTGINGKINNFWSCPFTTYFSVLESAGSIHNNIWGCGYNGLYQLTTNNTTNQSTPVQIKGSMSRTDTGISAVNLQDIVTMKVGGGTGASSNASLYLAMDLYGYVYAAGYDLDGASGAIADGTDGQYATQNVSKMQQFGSNSTSWQRVYMPNTQQGKIIDIFCTGWYADYASSNSGYPYYTTTYYYSTFSHSAFLSSDGAILNCGSNVYGYRNFGMFPGQGQSMRTPVYNPTFV